MDNKIDQKRKAIIALCNVYSYSLISMTQLFWKQFKERQNRYRRKFILQQLQSNALLSRIPMRYCTSSRPKLAKTKSNGWWESIVNDDDYKDDDWLENFRVTKRTFTYICNKLRDSLQSGLNSTRQNLLTVEKKVGVAMYILGTGYDFKVTANKFEINKSQAWKCVHEFVNAVNEILARECISIPEPVDAVSISQGFQAKCNLPNILGCIGRTHVPIRSPNDGSHLYTNSAGWPSMVLQVVVNHQYRFLNISIKCPGSSHDGAVLTKSGLYKNAAKILPQGSVNCGGKLVPYMIVSDCAYPLLPWLLSKYNDIEVTNDEESFNCYVNMACVNMETAIRRLKSRFHFLIKHLDVDYEFIPEMVATCCTLHNIMELQNNIVKTSWMKAVDDVELNFPQPIPQFKNNVILTDISASVTRDHLKMYISKNFPLRQTSLDDVK